MDWTLVIVVVASALLAALVTPAVFALSAAWKWSELDSAGRNRVLRVALGVAAIFGTIAAIVSGALAAITGSWWVASGGAAVVIALLIVWNLRSAEPITRIHRLGQQLEDPKKRDAARAKIVAIARDAKATEEIGKAIKIGAATVLSNGNYHDDARRILEAMPAEGLDTHDRELRALGLLGCRIHARDLQAARATLAEVPPLDPHGAHAQTLANLHALLLVLEGAPDEALALIGRASQDPMLERSRQGVLAHVHAARGDAHAMQVCLAWLREHHGDQGLQRVVDPEGPASRHAIALLKGGAAPYR